MSRIRPARPADAAALADLAAATFALACPPDVDLAAVAEHVRAALSAEHFTRHLADPTRLILIAENDAENIAENDAENDAENEELAGFTMLVFGEPDDADARACVSIRPVVEVSKCYVRADSHGSGLAGELMTATLQAGRDRGSAGAWLGVHELNDRALRFYAKHGFMAVGSKHFLFDGVNETDLVMQRLL
ncbi:MAG: GNAT family N-acetyltransferase [Cryobacterium sp.]